MSDYKVLVSCDVQRSIEWVDTEKRYELPSIYKPMEWLKQIRQVITNKLEIRLDDVSVGLGSVTIKTSRTTAYDTLLTNDVCCGEECKFAGEVIEPCPLSVSLRSSRLSNGLGVVVAVLTKDDFVLLQSGDCFRVTPNARPVVSFAMVKEVALASIMRRLDYKGDLKGSTIDFVGVFQNGKERGRPYLGFCINLSKTADEIGWVERRKIDKSLKFKNPISDAMCELVPRLRQVCREDED